jgi:hypothetical protein
VKPRLLKPSEAARKGLRVTVDRLWEALETPEDGSGDEPGDEPG